MIPLHELPRKDRLWVIRKMKFAELCKTRQSCRFVNSFVEENTGRILAETGLRLSIRPDQRQDFLLVQIHFPLKEGAERAIVHTCGDPPKQLQCASFQQFKIEASFSTFESFAALLPQLEISCLQFQLWAYNFDPSEVLKVLNTTRIKYKRIKVLSCKAELLQHVPRFCERFSAHILADAIPDFNCFNNFREVHIGRYPGGLSSDLKFVRFMKGLLTEGSPRLKRLNIMNKSQSLGLDCFKVVSTMILDRAIVKDSFQEAIYFVEINPEEAVLALTKWRYHFFFIPNQLKDILITIFYAIPFFTGHTLYKVPLDLSSCYESLLSQNPSDYGHTISNFFVQCTNNCNYERQSWF